MARPKSLGSYGPLSSSYYRDDAIMEAGEKAELLFLRGIAFCSETPSDGFISDRQLTAIVGIGLRNVTGRAQVLVDLGLWLRVTGGYVVRSWLKWNKSADEIGRALKKDRERKATPQDANEPPDSDLDSERNPDGIQTDSSPQYSTKHNTTKQFSSLHLAVPAERGRPPAFQDFMASYPIANDPDDAHREWDRAMAKGEDPWAIRDGAIRYRDDPNRDAQTTKYAKNWLRNRCWADGPCPPRPRSGRSTAVDRIADLDALKDPEPSQPPRAISGGAF